MRRRGVDGLIHETDEYTRFVDTNEEAERVLRCWPSVMFDVKLDPGWTNEMPTCLRCIGTLVR